MLQMINMIKCPSFAKCALFQFSCGAGFLLAASLFLSPHFLLLLLLFYLFDRLMFALREEITATAAIRPNIDASEISVCVCLFLFCVFITDQRSISVNKRNSRMSIVLFLKLGFG